MVFSSILFLCIFLPVTVAVANLLPERFKNTGLLLASLVFYAWGEPKNILIMLISIAFHYFVALGINRYQKSLRISRSLLALSVVLSLGALFFYKFTVLPIGISFYTFQILSYTIDVYRGEVIPLKNPLDLAMYVSLFPQLIAGPIVRFTDIRAQMKNRVVTGEMLFSGLFRFSVGLGKKVILANQIGLLWDEISKSSGTNPAATAWIGALAFTFQIYFDFSGYSDMAIGLGKMFGFYFPENFRYPYQSKSITEFWRRWHITLSGWFRDYVYIPLGGSKKGSGRQIFNLLIVWAFTGIWHGAGWNFLIWGLYYFLLLVLEKFVFSKVLESIPAFLRHIYSLFFIIVGWVIFACDDMEVLKDYFASLFGARGLYDSMSIYYFMGFLVLFIILVTGSTKIPLLAAEKLTKNRPILETVLKTVFIVVITLVCIILLIGDSYNPFLYFRF